MVCQSNKRKSKPTGEKHSLGPPTNSNGMGTRTIYPSVTTLSQLNDNNKIKQVCQLMDLGAFPTMLMAVASPRSATHPECAARWSPIGSRYRCIVDFSFTYMAQQHQPAAGHANGFQWAANPPKSAPSSGPKFTKRGEDLLPPGLPSCQISSPCIKPRWRYRLQKSCGHGYKRTNSKQYSAYWHCGVKRRKRETWKQLYME